MQSIEEVYVQYFQIVYKYVLYLTKGDKTVSEDITSETFAIAVEKINTFKGKCKISVWLCQIAKFLYFKEVKRNKKIKFEDINDLCQSENFEDDLIEQEDKKKIFNDIESLDKDTKNVIYMRVIGNFTFEEIAKLTGKTANWARVKYFRGKEKLKEGNKDEERM